jgi:hypothetical protein
VFNLSFKWQLQCHNPIAVPQPKAHTTINLDDYAEAEDVRPKVFWVLPCSVMTSGLTAEDKELILGGDHLTTGWLNDRVIDASMQILKDQFGANGLQSCLVAARPQYFDKQLGPWAQIVNTKAKTGGSHWILLSTYWEEDNSTIDVPVVNLFDSLWTGDTSEDVLETMASIIYTPQGTGEIDVRHMRCDLQPNMSDCGVHCIANLHSILSGVNPTTVRYLDSESMRQHLIECLENKMFTMFPSVVDAEFDEEPQHAETIIQVLSQNTPQCSLDKTPDVSNLSLLSPLQASPVAHRPRGRKERKTKMETNPHTQPPKRTKRKNKQDLSPLQPSPPIYSQRGRRVNKKKRTSIYSYY